MDRGPCDEVKPFSDEIVTKARHRILEFQIQSHATHTSNRSSGFVDSRRPQFLQHNRPAVRCVRRDANGRIGTFRHALSAFK